MGSNFLTSMVTVLTAIVGVAIVATLVSRNAQTPEVIRSFFGGFSQSLNAATGPVTGGGQVSATGGGVGAFLSSQVLPAFGTTANMV